MKVGMTREEKNWVLYDVGNSAFVLLVSTIMPIYFNYLARFQILVQELQQLWLQLMLHIPSMQDNLPKKSLRFLPDS